MMQVLLALVYHYNEITLIYLIYAAYLGYFFKL